MNQQLFRKTITPGDWGIVGAILGVTLAVGVVFYVGIYGAQLQTREQVDADIRSTLADLTTAREKQATIDKLRQEMDKTQALVNAFEDRLPSRRELTTLVAEFEELANEINLRVQVTPLEAQRDERKVTIPYRVNAFGNFHQIASFINRLERYERYLKISDLSISEEEHGVSEAEFIMSTYRFIEPSPVRTQEAPEADGGAA